MRKFIIVLIFGILLHSISFAQLDTVIIKSSYTNIAILKVDYLTNAFEGGNMHYYNCPTCTNDSLPFLYNHTNAPGEVVNIRFSLEPTLETVFYASEAWMSCGYIEYPDTFNTNYPFTLSNYQLNKKLSFKYLSSEVSHYPILQKQAELAWNSVNSLTITNEFLANDFKIGIYLYKPRLGPTDFSKVKWIFFLYCNNVNTSVDEYNNSDRFIIYPNPTADNIVLECNYSGSNGIQYSISDLSNASIKKGIIESINNKIDLSLFSKGIYFIALYASDGTYLTTKKIIKL